MKSLIRDIQVQYMKEFNLSDCKQFNVQEASNDNVFTRDGRQVSIHIADISRKVLSGGIYDVHTMRYTFTCWNIDGKWGNSETSDLDLFLV